MAFFMSLAKPGTPSRGACLQALVFSSTSVSLVLVCTTFNYQHSFPISPFIGQTASEWWAWELIALAASLSVDMYFRVCGSVNLTN